MFREQRLQVENAAFKDRDVFFRLAPVRVPDLLAVPFDLVDARGGPRQAEHAELLEKFQQTLRRTFFLCIVIRVERNARVFGHFLHLRSHSVRCVCSSTNSRNWKNRRLFPKELPTHASEKRIAGHFVRCQMQQAGRVKEARLQLSLDVLGQRLIKVLARAFVRCSLGLRLVLFVLLLRCNTPSTLEVSCMAQILDMRPPSKNASFATSFGHGSIPDHP